jgi:hypothetical protein
VTLFFVSFITGQPFFYLQITVLSQILIKSCSLVNYCVLFMWIYDIDLVNVPEFPNLLGFRVCMMSPKSEVRWLSLSLFHSGVLGSES